MVWKIFCVDAALFTQLWDTFSTNSWEWTWNAQWPTQLKRLRGLLPFPHKMHLCCPKKRLEKMGCVFFKGNISVDFGRVLTKIPNPDRVDEKNGRAFWWKWTSVAKECQKLSKRFSFQSMAHSQFWIRLLQVVPHPQLTFLPQNQCMGVEKSMTSAWDSWMETREWSFRTNTTSSRETQKCSVDPISSMVFAKLFFHLLSGKWIF